MKNRVPHKSLQEKTPIELFLEKDPLKARTNLRPFSQKVTCYQYETKASEKLASRSWEGRLVGYTTTFGTYQVMTSSGSFKIVKNPIPVQDRENCESESDSAFETVEAILEEALQTNPEEIEATKTSTTSPPPAPRKKKRTAAC